MARPRCPRRGTTGLNAPSDVAVTKNGDIFVAEREHDGNNRVVGTSCKSLGKTGYGPGEFRTLHPIAIDGKGRVFVGDGSNNRIQLSIRRASILTSWKKFGKPSGSLFDKKGQIFVADSESDDEQKARLGDWHQDGEVEKGWVNYFMPVPLGRSAGDRRQWRGIRRRRWGTCTGGREPRPRRLQKYVKVGPHSWAGTGG